MLAKTKLNMIDCLEDTDYDAFDEFRKAWAKWAVQINATQPIYQQAVLNGLKEEGHSVITLKESLTLEQTQELAAEIKAQVKESLTNQSEAIASAPEITAEEAERLENARSKENRGEQDKLTHYQLGERYQIPVSADLTLRDGQGWGTKIMLHYYLTEGRQFLKQRDRSKRDELARHDQVWQPDINRSLIIDQVRILEKFNIPSLLTKGEFRNSDPELVEMLAEALRCREQLKVFMGFTVQTPDSPEVAEKRIAEGKNPRRADTPINVLSKLLDKLGLSLTCIGKEGPKGEQQRVYKIGTVEEIRDAAAERSKGKAIPERWQSQCFALDDGRDCVFARWLQRDTEKAEKRKAAETPENTNNQPESKGNIKMYRTDTVVTRGYRSYITPGDYRNSRDYQTPPSDQGAVAVASQPVELSLEADPDEWVEIDFDHSSGQWFEVGPAQLPSTVAAVEKAWCDRPSPPIPSPPPPSPPLSSGGFAPGAVVKWGNRLSSWQIERIEGAIAHIHQVNGWAAQKTWKVPIQELKMLEDGAA